MDKYIQRKSEGATKTGEKWAEGSDKARSWRTHPPRTSREGRLKESFIAWSRDCYL